MRAETAPTHCDVTIILLAAGTSNRMNGRDKLLEEIAGMPLLRLSAIACLGAGCPVRVVLPRDAAARHAALKGLDVTVIAVDAADPAQSLSLRAGLGGIASGAVVVALADMPDITGSDIARLIAGWNGQPDAILRAASEDGRPGNPVLFGHGHFAALAALSGDKGARGLIASAGGGTLLRLDGDRALVDLDTPEDWAVWRARRK